MKSLDKQRELPLECYRNGELVVCTMTKAIDKLCIANHGIVAPLNECTWDVDGYRGSNNVFCVAGEKPTALGLYVHIYHGQPFTIDQAEQLINGKKELGQGLFVAWAARFNRVFRSHHTGASLPKELWPFVYVKVPFNGNGTLMRPAYQMRNGHTSFVVMGIDRDSVDPPVVPHWSSFWKEFLRRWSK